MNTVMAVLVGVSTAVFAGCSQTSQEIPSSTSAAELQETTLETTSEIVENDALVLENDVLSGEVDENQIREIQIEAGGFYYAPNELRVKKGETVRIVMNSVDMMHDFVIEELGVALPITRAGTTNTIEFTADQVGEFEFFCSVGDHRDQGQIGTLTVEE